MSLSSEAGGRVLLVEDEPRMRRALQRLIKKEGFVVDAAPDGDAALRLFAECAYDAVLTDIAMPGLDGVGFLRALRARDLDIPVILMTGTPTVDTAAKAVEYGAFQYLTKPFQSAELVATLNQATRRHRTALAERRASGPFGPHSVRHAERVALGKQLDGALDCMWMAFQPIVSAADGSLHAYEALLRSDQASLPDPEAVLVAAERLDRLWDVGRLARSRAATPMASASSTLLFINLHAKDLFDPDLIDPLRPLTAIAHRVVLEITERASLEVGDEVRARVALLRQLGFRIAIDDLGAGYAGLSALALLEPDVIKLDIPLVRGVHESTTRQKLIRSVTAFAKSMGTAVVAEGIEIPAERDTIIALGCDFLQGHLIARPGRPFPEIEAGRP